MQTGTAPVAPHRLTAPRVGLSLADRQAEAGRCTGRDRADRVGHHGRGTCAQHRRKGLSHRGLEPHHDVTHRFAAEAGALAARIIPTDTPEALVAAIRPPRAIILMVPAGPVVDDQIAALRPLLGPRTSSSTRAMPSSTTPSGARPMRPVRACPSSAWGSRAARRARAMAPRSWAAARARHGTAWPPCWRRSRPVRRHALRDLDGAGRRGPFRENGPQRHRICRHGNDRRTLRRHARRARDECRSDRPGLRALEQGHAALLPDRDFRCRLARDRPADGQAHARRDPGFGRAEGHRALDRDRSAASGHPGAGDRGGRGRTQTSRPACMPGPPDRAAMARPPRASPTGRSRSTISKRR